MPLVAEHLVIAKKYLENHPQKNKSEFINGREFNTFITLFLRKPL